MPAMRGGLGSAWALCGTGMPPWADVVVAVVSARHEGGRASGKVLTVEHLRNDAFWSRVKQDDVAGLRKALFALNGELLDSLAVARRDLTPKEFQVWVTANRLDRDAVDRRLADLNARKYAFLATPAETTPTATSHAVVEVSEEAGLEPTPLPPAAPRLRVVPDLPPEPAATQRPPRKRVAWPFLEPIEDAVCRLAREGYFDREIGEVVGRPESAVGAMRWQMGVLPGTRNHDLPDWFHPRAKARDKPVDERLPRMVTLALRCGDIDEVAAAFNMGPIEAQAMLGTQGYTFKREPGIRWLLAPTCAPPDPDWRDLKLIVPIGARYDYGQIHLEARARMEMRCRRCGSTNDIEAALRPGTPIERLWLQPQMAQVYSVSPDDYDPLCVSCHCWQDRTTTHCQRGHRRPPHVRCQPCGPMRRAEEKLSWIRYQQAMGRYVDR
jgi:hypothetical protein